MKDIDYILFPTYHYKIHFWLHFFCYQTIDRVFLKLCENIFFLDSCFFIYIHVFGEAPLNLQESVREKNHLVRIHLQE